jgi:hypothetical protein
MHATIRAVLKHHHLADLGPVLEADLIDAVLKGVKVSAFFKESELQERLNDALSSLEFYKPRVEALHNWQGKMREPERTIVRDIIANGQTHENPGVRYSNNAASASSPLVFGWAVLHCDGTTAYSRARVSKLFGASQDLKPFGLADLSAADMEWPSLAPHTMVTLYSGAHEAQAAQSSTSGYAKKIEALIAERDALSEQVQTLKEAITAVRAQSEEEATSVPCAPCLPVQSVQHPAQSKPLFIEMIEQHPGLAEELAAMDITPVPFAKQVGFCNVRSDHWYCTTEDIEKLVALTRADERSRAQAQAQAQAPVRPDPQPAVQMPAGNAQASANDAPEGVYWYKPKADAPQRESLFTVVKSIPSPGDEAHYKGVISGVQKIFDDKRAAGLLADNPVAMSDRIAPAGGLACVEETPRAPSCKHRWVPVARSEGDAPNVMKLLCGRCGEHSGAAIREKKLAPV